MMTRRPAQRVVEVLQTAFPFDDLGASSPVVPVAAAPSRVPGSRASRTAAAVPAGHPPPLDPPAEPLPRPARRRRDGMRRPGADESEARVQGSARQSGRAAAPRQTATPLHTQGGDPPAMPAQPERDVELQTAAVVGDIGVVPVVPPLRSRRGAVRSSDAPGTAPLPVDVPTRGNARRRVPPALSGPAPAVLPAPDVLAPVSEPVPRGNGGRSRAAGAASAPPQSASLHASAVLTGDRRSTAVPAALASERLPEPLAEVDDPRRERAGGPIFLMCYDDHPKRALQAKVEEAIAAYQLRFERQPTLVLVNAQVAGEVQVPDVRIEGRVSIPRHNFWVGQETEPAAPVEA